MAEPEKRIYPGNRFDAVKHNIELLHKLVDDPEFGCFTWHEMLNEQMLDLKANYFERDFEADAEK